MLNELNKIGIYDDAAGRAYIEGKIIEAYYSAQPIFQSETRYITETFIMGPLGGGKLELIWEGTNLITAIVKG